MADNDKNRDNEELENSEMPISPDQSSLPENELDKSESAAERIIIKETSEYKELEDKYLRLAAEFDNYKKRMAKEYSRVLDTAADEIIGDILRVIDDFDRALSHEDADANTFRQGIDLIYTKLMDSLKKKGLVQIRAKGERFDPLYHDAVMQLETDLQEEGTVIEEVQKGFLINNRVLRPARVVVAKKKEASSAEQTGEKQESR